MDRYLEKNSHCLLKQKNLGRFLYLLLLPLIISTFIACGTESKSKADNPPVETSPFTSPKNLSNLPGDSEGPLIAFEGTSRVEVAWLEKSGSSSQRILYAAESTDKGGNFSEAVAISSVNQSASAPTVLMGADNTMYSWVTTLITQTPEISLLVFYNTGVQGKVLVDDVDNPSTARPVMGAGGSGEIYLAWAGEESVYFSKSTDDGRFSSSPTTISEGSFISEGPLLGIEGSNTVNLAWVDTSADDNNGMVRYARSSDGGDSFSSPPIKLSTDGIDASCPQLAVGYDQKVYVAWAGTEGGISDIYATVSADGNPFSAPVQLGRLNAGCPGMAIAPGGEVYLVWEESSNIYFVKFFQSSKGGHFSIPKIISGSSGTASSPRIALDKQYINIIWVDSTTKNKEIYFAGSDDYGKSFSEPLNISNTSTDSVSPAIAANGNGMVYIAWSEGVPGEREIYFAAGKGASGFDTPGAGFRQNMDVNGDGYGDFIVGAPGTVDAERPGRAYIYFGGEMDNMLDDIPDIILAGFQDGDMFGKTVSLNDIDGDGFADAIVGAPEDNSSGTGIGKVYIYFGGPSMPSSITEADISIVGERDRDKLGYSVSTAGDLNGDGYGDIIIGAPFADFGWPDKGLAYIFMGGAFLFEKAGYPDISASTADVIITGKNISDRLGTTVSWAGDVNGDGYSDVMTGAPYADYDGIFDRGQVYIMFGSADMDNIPDVVLTGEDANDNFGLSLSHAGDINGDGYDDVIAGTPLADGGGLRRGVTYIFYGGNPMDEKADIIFEGPEDHSSFGSTVGGAGDFNGDGYKDILVAAPRMDTDNLINNGVVFLYYGGPLMDEQANLIFAGKTDYDLLGENAVVGAGDVNGDGYDDILIGAYLADGGGVNRGEAYLFSGGIFPDNGVDLTLSGEEDGDRFGSSVFRRK